MARPEWIGGATAIRQESLLTLGGTYAVGDKITISLSGASELELTIGSASLNDIGTDIVFLLTGTGTLANGSSVTNTGNNFGEFTQLSSVTYESASTRNRLIGQEDGRPFTPTATTTSASGTIVASTAVTPTGPHHANNAKNWSTGSIPGAGDTMIMGEKAVADMRYEMGFNGLNQPVGFDYRRDCRYNYGLALVNAVNPSLTFPEILPTTLEVGYFTGFAFNHGVNGAGDGSLMGWGKIDLNDDNATCVVGMTARRTTEAPLSIRSNTAGQTTKLVVRRGDVDIAVADADAAQLDELSVTFTDNPAQDSQVTIGEGVIIGKINMLGGQVTNRSAPTTLNGLSGRGTYVHDSTGNISTVDLKGTTFTVKSVGSTINTLRAFDFGFVQIQGDVTITNADLFRGSGWEDENGLATLTNDLDLHGQTPFDLRRKKFPVDRRWSYSGSVT